jgi:hypothetical protein
MRSGGDRRSAVWSFLPRVSGSRSAWHVGIRARAQMPWEPLGRRLGSERRAYGPVNAGHKPYHGCLARADSHSISSGTLAYYRPQSGMLMGLLRSWGFVRRGSARRGRKGSGRGKVVGALSEWVSPGCP